MLTCVHLYSLEGGANTAGGQTWNQNFGHTNPPTHTPTDPQTTTPIIYRLSSFLILHCIGVLETHRLKKKIALSIPSFLAVNKVVH